MKREAFSKILLVVLVVGLNMGPEQKCRDKSDANAAISYDYCVWAKSGDGHQRTPAQWNNLLSSPVEPISRNLAVKGASLRPVR